MSKPTTNNSTRTTIKKGYKNTEIGVIPEDWEVVKLDEVVDFLDGQRRPIKANERKSGIYPYYGASGVIDYVNDYIFDDDLILLGEDGENILSRNLPLAFQVDGKIWVNNHAHVLKPKKNVIIGFLTDYLESLDYVLLNSGTAQPKLNKQACVNLNITLPPLPEQTAIATVLSDTDKLLQALEKKIDKKRLIKQGAMQVLLEPKEGWVVKTLGDVAEIKTGSKNNQDKIKDGKYPFFVRSQTVERLNSYSYDCEAILIPGEGGIGSIYHYINGKFDVHQRVYKISNFKEYVSGKFIFLYMKKNFNSHATKNSVKATVDSLRLPTFLEFEIILPSKQEQIRIATILSDMDKEIETLEKQLAKYKQVKQGLMQVLLTGKIRLV